jgi:hypothetical protein
MLLTTLVLNHLNMDSTSGVDIAARQNSTSTLETEA